MDKNDAKVIRKVFLRRATGSSWTELADFLTASRVKSSKGSAAWSITGTSSLVKNRVYRHAHAPVVTQAEFDAAQSQRTLLQAHEWLDRLSGTSRWVGALRGLWSHPQDHRQHRENNG